MAQRIQQLIRLLNHQTVEKDLVRTARERLGQDGMDSRELRHLVAVLTNPGLLVTSLYDLIHVAHLREGGNLPIASLRFWKSLHQEDPEVIHRVLRAPDTMKAVGDKCLFEQAVAGAATSTGVSEADLTDIGRQAYESASQVLEILADDRLLRDYYEASGLGRDTLDEEVSFFRRCADRFSLYAELLHDVVLSSDPLVDALRDRETLGQADEAGEIRAESPAESPADDHEDEGGSDAPAAPTPENRANSLARPRIDLGRTRTGLQPLDEDSMALSQLLDPAEREDPTGALTRLERWALFSSLDVEALRRRLDQLIVNQSQAIQRLSDDLCLLGTGTADPRRPTSYFLIGPTGVGKNYLVEQLVEGFRSLWDIEIPFLLIEGPQYTYPSDINELKGAARGFIRSDEEGIMTEFHKKSKDAPLAVVLIDEVEKAHPQLRRFFLSVMDRGTMTDNRGQTLNFANTMFFYTSNVGYSDMSQRTRPIGYGNEESTERRFVQDIELEVKRQLSPEFINRITMLHFNYLRRRDAERIFDLELAKIAHRYQEHQQIELVCTPAAKAEIMRRGFDREYGARNLATVLNRVVNIGVSRRLRRDDAGAAREEVEDLLQTIRDMRAGEEDPDLRGLEARVAESARARVLYRGIVVDFQDGDFLYEPR